MAATAGHVGFYMAGPDTGPELWIQGAGGSQPEPATCFNAWLGDRPRLDMRLGRA